MTIQIIPLTKKKHNVDYYSCGSKEIKKHSLLGQNVVCNHILYSFQRQGGKINTYSTNTSQNTYSKSNVMMLITNILIISPS